MARRLATSTAMKPTMKTHHHWSLRHEIHAELNAVIWAARCGTAIEGATAYVTHSPCDPVYQEPAGRRH